MHPTLITILALILSMSVADAEERQSATAERTEEPAADADIPMECEAACDFESFKTQLNAWTKSQGMKALEEARIREIFNSVDKNSNRELDPIEIRELSIKIVVGKG